MAQGNYGTSDDPLEAVHGEQWVYEPLTSDPSDREEGATWFRSDLDSGDKIGTLRLQNDDAGTDIDDIPVFAEGDAVSGVVKARPIQTPNGEAFIPYIQEGGAFDHYRFQHGGTWYGAHNALIDESPLAHHWPTDEGSGSTLADSKGSLDASISGATWQSGAGLGSAYLEFDGSNDEATVSDASLGDSDYSFIGWARPDAGGEQRAYGGDEAGSRGWYVAYDQFGNDEWRLLLDEADGGESLEILTGEAHSTEDWIFLAFVADITAGEVTFYWGTPGDSDLSSSTNTSYDDGGGQISNIDTVRMGGENGANFFEGGCDDWHVGPGETASQSDIEEWFDATKGNYPGGSGNNNGSLNAFSDPSSGLISVRIDNGNGYVAAGRNETGDDTVYKFDADEMDGDGSYSGHSDRPRVIRLHDGVGYSAGQAGGNIHMWDPTDMTAIDDETVHTEEMFAIAFNDTWGFSAGDDQVVRKWDPDDLSTESETFDDHTDPRIYGLAVDDTHGFSGGRDDTVRKWDISTMTQQDSFSTPHDTLAIHIDSNYVYSACRSPGDSDAEVYKLNKSDLSQDASQTSNGELAAYGLAVSANYVFVGTDSNKVLKLDKSDLSVDDEFTGANDRVYSVDVDSAEEYVYAASWDSNVYKIDIDTMELAD